MERGKKLEKTIVSILLILAMFMPLPVFAAEEEPAGSVPEQGAVQDEEDDATAEMPAVTFDESEYRTLSGRTIRPKKIKNVNLRTMIKEKRDGYSVVQGSCTDGKYAYYIMVSSKTQKGRILKVRIKGNKVVKRSKVLKTWHSNGMTYDSKRKVLVVNAREDRKQELTVIDAATLKVVKQKNVKYSNYAGTGGSIRKLHSRQGLAAMAYSRRYDCYIALERVYHNLLFFDSDSFECIGMARTAITAKYPGTYQAMDADDKYVYLLLSKHNEKSELQPNNLILALDWNSENLLPAVNAAGDEPDYIPESWACNNDGSGRPDAVIRLKNKYEAESIYHTTRSGGAEHFYLAEYYNHPLYRTVKKKVRVNGKWKTKKVRKVKYLRRENYVYDLGII